MKLILKDKKEVAKDTVAFWFEPEREIAWKPGQYFHIILPKLIKEDERGPMRPLSIASSPTEGTSLVFATRIRDKSGFKQTLNSLEIGTQISGDDDAGGNFVLNSEKKEKQIFIAGGIGITPFRSIIKYSIDKGFKTPLHLICANKSLELVPFREEINSWSQSHVNFNVTHVISQEEGRLSKDKLSSIAPDDGTATYWVAGPSSLVSAVEGMLSEIGIPDDRLEIEKFSGY